MAHADTPAVPSRPRVVYLAVQALAGAAIVALLWYVVVQGGALLREYRQLRRQHERIDLSAVVGYIDIHAEPSFARAPADWCHDEGDATLLWAGWRDGKHDWFRLARGDVAAHQVVGPMGRDVVRAIDHPIVEGRDGRRWAKVPDAAPVAALLRAGVRSAYPIVVLSKVEVVNDTLGEEPVLLVFRPFAPLSESVAAFAPVVGGRRITMGLSGYLMDKRPVLYDRGTRSLWHDRDGGLVAIAGPLKGTALPTVDGVEILEWSDWRGRYPEGRLVVGADRKKPRPEL